VPRYLLGADAERQNVAGRIRQLQQITISGTKYEDHDGNGVRDVGDEGFPAGTSCWMEWIRRHGRRRQLQHCQRGSGHAPISEVVQAVGSRRARRLCPRYYSVPTQSGQTLPAGTSATSSRSHQRHKYEDWPATVQQRRPRARQHHPHYIPVTINLYKNAAPRRLNHRHAGRRHVQLLRAESGSITFASIASFADLPFRPGGGRPTPAAPPPPAR